MTVAHIRENNIFELWVGVAVGEGILFPGLATGLSGVLIHDTTAYRTVSKSSANI